MKFAVLLNSCKNTLQDLCYMGPIEKPDILRRIVTRIPFDTKKHWISRADEISEMERMEILYGDIADFIAKEARIASHPFFGDIVTIKQEHRDVTSTSRQKRPTV